ncbi:hypothetical protein Tco_1086613 [Tanacetum coccineum]
MAGGLLRGTPGDNIGPTPAGITRNVFGSTSGGPPEINVETPLTGLFSPQGNRSKGIYRPSAEGSDNCNRDSRRRQSEEAFQGSSENSLDPEDKRVRWPRIHNASEHQVVRRDD